MKFTIEQLRAQGFNWVNPKSDAPTVPMSGIVPNIQPAPKRIRQSSKPLMNKLEQEFFNLVSVQFPNYDTPRPQAITFRLCNGVRYTPDVFAHLWPVPGEAARPTAWEIKGKHAWDDSIVKLKMFAHEYPEIRVLLTWKDAGVWQQQVILP